jgi:serine/threonine-protein kinase ATR
MLLTVGGCYVDDWLYCWVSCTIGVSLTVISLGDRHGENILMDDATGDCVHVDFNCLFGKGLTFEKPEKVPFRLTQNMVDAMGLTGYEGVFRKVCELTLGVLRANRETLMSVLETFIHDPLVEWTKDSNKKTIRTVRSCMSYLLC